MFFFLSLFSLSTDTICIFFLAHYRRSPPCLCYNIHTQCAIFDCVLFITKFSLHSCVTREFFLLVSFFPLSCSHLLQKCNKTQRKTFVVANHPSRYSNILMHTDSGIAIKQFWFYLYESVIQKKKRIRYGNKTALFQYSVTVS